MIAMDLIHADDLTPSQLMIGDLIKVNDDIVEVIYLESDSTGDNYSVETQNEFGEREVVLYSYTDTIPFYVFIDEEYIMQHRYFKPGNYVRISVTDTGLSQPGRPAEWLIT